MGTENLDRSAVGKIEVNPGGGWQDLGVIREETIRVNGEEVKHYDVSSYPFGTDMTIFGNLDIEIEFVWEEIANIDLWNVMLHGGSVSTTNAGTQAVADEPVVMNGSYASGKWNALIFGADFDEDCSVTVSSESGGGGTTYTEDTDYIIDRKGGHIGRVSAGSITDGQTVYVDYTYKTYDGKYFEMFEDVKPEDHVLRLTKPLLNGDNMRITHGKVNLSSTMELPLNPGDEGAWAGVTSKIKFLKNPGGAYGAYGRWEIYTP